MEVGDAGAPKKPPRYDVLGVDMSTTSALRSVRDAGYAFVMVQAGLGSQANKDFARNWTMARQCGLARGAYHFLHPVGDPTQQADLFVRQLDKDLGELPPVVDVELPPGCKGPCCEVSCEAWASSTSRWLERVHKTTGRKPMVYTVEDFWKECLCNTSRFANHGLWLAGYPTFDLKDRPGFGGWQKWVMYQHAGNVRYGRAVLDLDVFRGDRAAFDALVAKTRVAPTGVDSPNP